ncbi:MAG: hypothetical protein JWN85_3091 [Gammaproteobacteria bacterium]|nr:hypothetical protein [Gammaproteobacteria bacterium]
MSEFLLLLHQDLNRPRPGSPDEAMAMTRKYMDWADRMRSEGRLKAGQKLTDEPGKVLRPSGGRVAITDGPYAESKELLGGYFLITANDYAEACRLSESCPHLQLGGRIEVRQIHEM